MRKLLLLAGEESGVAYAEGVRARLGEGWDVRGYADYGFATADLAVMGFWAVLRRLGFFLRVKRTMERAIDAWRPDVVCTVDYPGLNLKLAAYAKARGIRAVHVVAPQVWAWRKGRIPAIEAALDRLCCFFPFEPELFRPGLATFVGHPLVEAFRSCRRESAPGLVALLPGSRLGEIDRHLPTLLEAVRELDADVVIPAAHARARVEIERIVRRAPAGRARVRVQDGGARELLLKARCAAVASGTATLEAALARCPTVLVYRVSAALAWFARRVIREISHVGLANVVWEKCGRRGAEPMPELLQEAFTAEAVRDRLVKMLRDDEAHGQAVAALDATMALLESASAERGGADPLGLVAREIAGVGGN